MVCLGVFSGGWLGWLGGWWVDVVRCRAVRTLAELFPEPVKKEETRTKRTRLTITRRPHS